MPKVSIIMPIYNHGKFAAGAIQSALDQTFQDFEIVVTNDGSTDNTAEELKKFKDPRIRVFTFERNRGIGMAMNNCIKHASGEYIAHLNADDLFFPDKLEKQVKFLNENKDIGAVFSYARIIDDNGNDFADANHFLCNIYNQENRRRQDWLRRFFYEGNCLCHPSAMVRKDCFDKVGLYDGRYHQIQDFELWIRLCMKYEIHIIPEKLVSFRVHSGETSISGYSPERRNRTNWELVKVLDHFINLSDEDLILIFPEIKNQYEDSFDIELVPFYLAMTALKANQSRLHFFGVNTLYSLLKDEKIVTKLEKLYDFNYSTFVRLAGISDTFNFLQLIGRDQEIKKLSDLIRENDIKSQQKINNLKLQIHQKEYIIQQTKQEIGRIRSSIFWKLRNNYLRLKNIILRFPFLVVKGLTVLKKHGMGEFIKRFKNIYKIKDRSNFAFSDYNLQRRSTEKKIVLKWRDLRQKSREFNCRSLVSVVMPVYNVEIKWLKKAIDSVLGQLYENWELCIVDDKSTDGRIRLFLEDYCKKDKRIKLKFLEKNLHISGSSNKALKMAEGEFVAFMDHDDEITPDALYEAVKALNQNKDIDVIYSDEDKIDENGIYSDPAHKPEWNLDRLLTFNYTAHLSVYRKKMLDKIGGFRIGYEGAQDYDLMLRVSECAENIFHLPKVLYHWRKLPSSVAVNPDSKPYAYEAGKKALEDYLKRNRIQGEVSMPIVGRYRIERR